MIHPAHPEEALSEAEGPSRRTLDFARDERIWAEDAISDRPCSRRGLGLRVPADRLVAANAARLRRLVRAHRPRAEPAPRFAHRLGVRRRTVRRGPQLDRDRLHFPGGDAGVARLDRGGPAVALLAIYPMLAAGLHEMGKAGLCGGRSAPHGAGRRLACPRDGGVGVGECGATCSRLDWNRWGGDGRTWRGLARFIGPMACRCWSCGGGASGSAVRRDVRTAAGMAIALGLCFSCPGRGHRRRDGGTPASRAPARPASIRIRPPNIGSRQWREGFRSRGNRLRDVGARGDARNDLWPKPR